MSDMTSQHNRITEIDRLIGKKIYELRLGHGMSRKKLGKKLNVTHQQVMKYEKGHNRVSAGKLFLIANVLQADILYFYEDLEAEKPMITKHQRMCLEISRNFMQITAPNHQAAINSLVKELATNK